MAETPEPIGERLKRLRTERGLTQKEIAAPGVGHAYISPWGALIRSPRKSAGFVRG
jgi:hypothetical protein